jgi:arylsulfatase
VQHLAWPVSLLASALLFSAGCDKSLLPKADSEEPLNLIVISVDTVRADHYGAYGYEHARTPVVDRLAKEGTTFRYAIAPIPRTTPALASMMTGLYPHEHGARDVNQRVRKGTFVAAKLREAGFTTSAVTANPAAGKSEGFADDFGEFIEIGMSKGNKATRITDEALGLNERAPKDKPLFLWVHYIDPHSPYKAPKEWREKPQDKCDALIRIKQPRGLRRVNYGGHSAEAIPHCLNAYDAEIAYTDSEIGRLMKGLRKSGRLDNAVVLFTSDHGENFGEWGAYYGHGVNVHDGAVRVPLIIAGPGIKKGATVDEVIGLHDLAPTMLSLMNIPESEWPGMSGNDYSAFVREGQKPEPMDRLAYARSGGALLIDFYTALLSGRPRTGYCINKDDFSLCWKRAKPPELFERSDIKRTADVKDEHPEIYEALMAARERWKPGSTRQQSVSDGRFKLVERPRFEGGYERALYDLQADPAETLDVQAEHPEDYSRLAQALEGWTENIPGYVQQELSAEQEAQLRALGYVE